MKHRDPIRSPSLASGLGGALLLGALLGVWVSAAEPEPKQPPQWVFELLPRSLQKNPRLDLTVITEMTPEGRCLPPVDPGHPAYYVAQSAGYRRTRDGPVREQTIAAELVDAFVRRSLAERGYLPAADPASPAALVLVYYWGLHGRPEADEALTANDLAGNLLDRAALVGGEGFRAELSRLMAESSLQAEAGVSPTRHMAIEDAPVAPVLGPDQLEFLSPLNRFRDLRPENEFLLEQAGSDVYYVVVSAYDGAELRRNRRVLLWRTRMTAAADGIAQADALPTLVAAASPYFGREMSAPVILRRRATPAGEVTIGAPTVVEEDVPAQAPRPPGR